MPSDCAHPTSDTSARRRGDLYALSTIGSVLAALLTGFVLIPYFGVGRLLFLVGALLLAMAFVGFFGAGRVRTAGIAALVVLPVAVLASRAAAEEPDPENGLLSIEHSPYAEIRVVDVGDIRYMLIDGGTHTIVRADTLESTFPYVHVLDVVNQILDPGKLLLVGLGGGSVAKIYARQGWDVEAVEIDPVVTRVARRDFGLEESEARVFHDDGRHFLASSTSTYDAIVLDAFGSSSIPFHLTTRESFALVAAHLEPDGVLAINVESVGWDDVLVRALAATLREEFEHVLALPIAEPPDQLGNLILLASQRELELAPRDPADPGALRHALLQEPRLGQPLRAPW